MHTKFVLITGGCGYIGSHMAIALKKAGYIPIILDNLTTGHQDSALESIFIEGEISDSQLLHSIFKSYPIDAVMHFAGSIDVNESVIHPTKYYQNNVAASLCLFESMRKANVNNIIFSSTAAVYGEPCYTPIDEAHPIAPINPYGHSKYMVETIIQDYARSFGWHYGIVRYFNAAGCDPTGIIGELHQPETHLIPRALSAALHNETFMIYGSDYETKDGTCIRDYIHVEDICSAHLRLLEKLLHNNINGIYNLGNGCGFSVQEVIDCVEAITKTQLTTLIKPRRKGDPAILVANANKAKTQLAWQPNFDLQNMVQHTYHFMLKTLVS